MSFFGNIPKNANPTQYALGPWAPKPPKTHKAKLVHAVISDPFCLGYVDGVLASEDAYTYKGSALNKTHGINDFPIKSLERILADCTAFREMPYVEDAIGDQPEQAGYDFWLAVYSDDGFWGLEWNPSEREILLAAARRFPELDVYIGVNSKKLYFEEM